MKSIEIVTDEISDNAIRVVQDNYLLVFLTKEDKYFSEYLAQKDAQISGIYILIGDKNENGKYVYIGQSEEIRRRLEQHQKDDKKPWKAVYFFGQLNGELEKTQRDYLEEKLIEEYKNNGIQTDNKTRGNSHGSLSTQSKMKADKIFNWFLATINDVLSYDIFDNKKERIKSTNAYAKTRYKIVLDGEEVSVNTVTDMVRFVAKELFKLNENKAEKLAEQNQEAAPSMLFATFEKVGKSGTILNEKIENADIYFYNNFNPDYAIKTLSDIAKQFDVNLQITKDDNAQETKKIQVNRSSGDDGEAKPRDILYDLVVKDYDKLKNVEWLRITPTEQYAGTNLELPDGKYLNINYSRADLFKKIQKIKDYLGL